MAGERVSPPAAPLSTTGLASIVCKVDNRGMTESLPLQILLIGQDSDTRDSLRDILLLDGHRVETVKSVEEALEWEDGSGTSVVILDHQLMTRCPPDLLPTFQRRASSVPIIVLTAQGDTGEAIAAFRGGAEDYLVKPIDPDAVRAVLRRITASRRTERQLAVSEARQRALLAAIPDTILRISRAGVVRDVHVPRDDLIGLWPVTLSGLEISRADLPGSFLEQLLTTIETALATGTAQVLEAALPTRLGRRFFEFRVGRSGDDEVVTIVRDVTAAKQSVARSLQAERLAAIGQMVAGLAHESRNAFQRSQAFLEMLAMEVEDRPEALQLVERIQQTQDHLHYLYEEVRNYAAPINLDLQLIDVGHVWRATWTNLEVERGRKQVELVEQPYDVNRVCRVDPNALEQVFRNVLQNAIDACREPGRIEIRCRAGQLDKREALQVHVIDNGPGFEPEARADVFEPFFTTKTRGTGLGMAIARRVVETHGGRIRVGDRAGAGAEIVISLPR